MQYAFIFTDRSTKPICLFCNETDDNMKRHYDKKRAHFKQYYSQNTEDFDKLFILF